MIYQVVVHGVMGRDIVVDVAYSEGEFQKTTVSELMKLVASTVLKSDTTDFKLMFATFQLDPAKTLSDYQIKNKSTLTMVMQLPGGN
ncbi:polyubiquitin-A-like [Carlito syrichta]|uniref:Polyubiquitin-A-like n=1 Tax=Carlito syrichta TaxID=1868482 RepID=A0A1U7T3S1_CARSF|nr:polyubiquitin-A-like [Carlito syrichta]